MRRVEEYALIVGGRARLGDSVHHAVMVRSGPWEGTHTATTLCGRTGVGLSAFRHDPVTGRSVPRDDAPGFNIRDAHACLRCAEILTARFAPPIGVPHDCRSCGETQDVSQFKTDLRTRDGTSLDCHDCRKHGRPRNSPCIRCGKRLDAQPHGIGLCKP